MDEKELVRKAKKGDKNAFAKLYTLYKDRLYRYAYYKVGEEDAYDAVSDCIMQAWANIKSLRSEKVFSAWIFRILYRSCSAHIREQIRQKEFEDIETLDIPTSENYKSAELKEALAILNDDEKDIVLLSAAAGYTSKEIGKILELEPSTVRSKLSRSLKKMREFLE